MKTFKELFCAEHGCDLAQFRSIIFRACLPLRARLLVNLLGGLNGKFFEADRELISGAGDATAMYTVHEEIRDFFMHPASACWLRRFGGVRLSTKRLKSIARRYLKEARQNSTSLAGGSCPEIQTGTQ